MIAATLDESQIDRVEGVLLGQACGDALGVPYEFAATLDPSTPAEMSGGGLGGYPDGGWSDDTEMAVCIARVAATGADLTDDRALDAIAEGFVGWFAAGPGDVGVQTSSVLGAASHGDGPAGHRLADAAATYHREHPHNSAGNGALMRTSVVGVCAIDDRTATAASARRVAALTHADPLAVESCVLWCEAIRVAVLEARLDIRAGLDLVPGEHRERWSRWLDEAELRTPGAFTPNGFTVTALQAAWAVVAMAENTPALTSTADRIEAALQAAVHIGDDTDTVAAIAGGLLGARWGASAIPPQWRSRVNGWPGLRADDLVSLAHAAACRGSGSRPTTSP